MRQINFHLKTIGFGANFALNLIYSFQFCSDENGDKIKILREDKIMYIIVSWEACRTVTRIGQRPLRCERCEKSAGNSSFDDQINCALMFNEETTPKLLDSIL